MSRPEVSVNLESGDECLVIEGRASILDDAPTSVRVGAEYDAKYNWEMDAGPGTFFSVAPRVAFGWIVDGSGLDGGALFALSATRWTFGES